MIDDDPLTEIPDSALNREVENFYDLLQVRREAASDEIQRAYREMISEYHPDQSDHKFAEEMTNALNKSKEILLEQSSRLKYNELGHRDFFKQSMMTTTQPTKESTDEDNHETSLYSLIRLAKVNNYQREVWWKTVLKSTGFKITLGVTGFLAVLFVGLLVI